MNQIPAEAEKAEESEETSFAPYLTIFTPYASFEKIPGAVFRRAHGIIQRERIRLDKACDEIAEAIWKDQNKESDDSTVPINRAEEIEDLRERTVGRILQAPPSHPNLPPDNAEQAQADEETDGVQKIS